MRDDVHVPQRRQPPTIRMRQLAYELRRLRERAGLSQEDVSTETHVNVASIYRIETGQTRPQLRTLHTLLTAYGADETQRAEILALHKGAAKRGTLLAPDSSLREQYTSYINFEAEALEILNYETILVPGLLPGATEDDRQARVDARLQRQQLLTSSDSPQLWVVIDEAALHRSVGGPAVMREQLLHLAKQARNPRITLQVIRFQSGAHPGMPGSFVILRFGPIAADIVYIDSMGGDLFLEEEAELTRHNMVFEHLRAVALSPSDTTALLTSLSDSHQ
jgi:transcriptional regulator with XRE-family HTH domain